MADDTLMTGDQQTSTDGSPSGSADGGAQQGGGEAPAQSGGQAPPQGGEGEQGGSGQPESQPQDQGGAGEAGGEQPSDGSGEDAGEQGGEDGAEQGPPEQYDFTNAMPEGMEVDQTAVDQIAPVFKELGLTQEEADKVVQVHAQHLQQQQQAAQEQRQQQIQQWQEDVRNDPDIGGDALDENLATAKKALDAFDVKDEEGNGRLAQLLEQTGLGNHPTVVKTFHAIGQKLSEDNFVTGNAPQGEEASREERLYGKTTPTGKK